jgi:hypothetical protein
MCVSGVPYDWHAVRFRAIAQVMNNSSYWSPARHTLYQDTCFLAISNLIVACPRPGRKLRPRGASRRTQVHPHHSSCHAPRKWPATLHAEEVPASTSWRLRQRRAQLVCDSEAPCPHVCKLAFEDQPDFSHCPRHHMHRRRL